MDVYIFILILYHTLKVYEVPIPKDGQPNMTKHHEFLLDLLDTARQLLGDFESASLAFLAPHFFIPGIFF